MTEKKIAALPKGENDDVFDDLENLVIRFTDEIVHGVKANDETFEAMAERFDHRQMNEAVLTVGFYMMVCRYLENFEIEREDEGDVDPTLNFVSKS